MFHIFLFSYLYIILYIPFFNRKKGKIKKEIRKKRNKGKKINSFNSLNKILFNVKNIQVHDCILHHFI